MADVATPDSVAAASSPNGGGARIGRPPQWTESRSRKLARLYMYTTLPMEKIIKALFPNDDVKYAPPQSCCLHLTCAVCRTDDSSGKTRPRRPSTRWSAMTLGP